MLKSYFIIVCICWHVYLYHRSYNIFALFAASMIVFFTRHYWIFSLIDEMHRRHSLHFSHWSPMVSSKNILQKSCRVINRIYIGTNLNQCLLYPMYMFTLITLMPYKHIWYMPSLSVSGISYRDFFSINNFRFWKCSQQFLSRNRGPRGAA